VPFQRAITQNRCCEGSIEVSGCLQPAMEACMKCSPHQVPITIGVWRRRTALAQSLKVTILYAKPHQEFSRELLRCTSICTRSRSEMFSRKPLLEWFSRKPLLEWFSRKPLLEWFSRKPLLEWFSRKPLLECMCV